MKTKEIIEKLHGLNAFISGRYITKIEKIDYKGICLINQILGEIIEEIREEEKKTNEN